MKMRHAPRAFSQPILGDMKSNTRHKWLLENGDTRMACDFGKLSSFLDILQYMGPFTTFFKQSHSKLEEKLNFKGGSIQETTDLFVDGGCADLIAINNN